MKWNLISPEWPALDFERWVGTRDTLHMWTQIVGKTRLALTPLENHWWNTTLFVTPRGLRTPPNPYERGTFEVEFDLVAHQLRIQTSEGQELAIPLFPRSVADFFHAYMEGLRSLGIEVNIWKTPVEFDDTTPFDRDTHHAAYDKDHVESFRRVLVNTDRIFRKFRARFLGKCSPVHFYWGSFDLAVTRFSGRPAAQRLDADAVTREAYSHEVISCGFWPGDRRFPHAAFYSYTAPPPAGLDREPVRPQAAYWDTKLGEFLLKYDAARNEESPESAILDFCQSTYEAGAKLANWDRAALERQSSKP